jgi:hypothetical protein
MACLPCGSNVVRPAKHRPLAVPGRDPIARHAGTTTSCQANLDHGKWITVLTFLFLAGQARRVSVLEIRSRRSPFARCIWPRARRPPGRHLWPTPEPRRGRTVPRATGRPGRPSRRAAMQGACASASRSRSVPPCPRRQAPRTKACAGHGPAARTRAGTAPMSIPVAADRPGSRQPRASASAARRRKISPGKVLLRGCSGSISASKSGRAASRARPSSSMRRAASASSGADRLAAGMPRPSPAPSGLSG